LYATTIREINECITSALRQENGALDSIIRLSKREVFVQLHLTAYENIEKLEIAPGKLESKPPKVQLLESDTVYHD